jgi:dCTP deaminase
MKEGIPLGLFSRKAELDSRKQGILPSQEIRELISNGKICASTEIAENQIQPASIDLRLGKVAYRVEASFLPSTTPISAKIRSLQIEEIDLTRPALLSKGNVFIVPLIERLVLPADLSGKANPKSTTGRLDIFTRLMTEGGAEFEQVLCGYRGDLYLEIVPRTFSVLVAMGTKLNQLRFWRGDPQRDDDDLRNLDRKHSLVYYDDSTNSKRNDDDVAARVVPARASIGGGLRLSVDLRGSEGQSTVAYRARQDTAPIDLSKVGAYDPATYWEQIVNPRFDRLVLQPGDFYLLASRERVGVPPGYAAEMEQYDPSLGEFSVHYAGFFDPGFGFGADGEIKGTRAVLEVRAHEVPILLEDQQTVGRLNYYKMANVPEKIYGQVIGSSYQQQGLALSKQFRTEAVSSALTGAHR